MTRDCLSIRFRNLFVVLSKRLRIVICTGIIGLFIDHFVRTLKCQIVTFSILWLLLLQACREKMSLSYLVNEFIEKCTIENKIDWIKKRWFFDFHLLPGTNSTWTLIRKADVLPIFFISMVCHLGGTRDTRGNENTYIFNFKKGENDSFFLWIDFVPCILESSKKMSAVVHRKNIFIYFHIHLNYAKVKNLHSFCILRLDTLLH